MGEGSVFTAPKTEHGRRLVPMRPVLQRLLEQHQRTANPNEHDLVFANQAGEPLDATNVINRIYLPAIKRAGLRRIRFHDLRHTFVTYCAAAGVPLVKVGDPEIAAELYLSLKTVETHLRNSFRKLGIDSRIDLARAVERADRAP